MDNLTGIIHAVCKGFIDSLKGAIVLFHIQRQINERLINRPPSRTDKHKRNASTHSSAIHSNQQQGSTVLKRTIECCVLNGMVFWVSITIFESGLLPFIKYLLTIIFGHSPGMAATVWSWTQPFLSFTFETVWVLPFFLLSRIVSSFWFQDIADSAYRYRQGKPSNPPNWAKLVADYLFSLLVATLFLGQSTLVSKMPLPLLGDILSLVHTCLLYALYAFEYKWYNMGWELHRRLTFIEENWPYFLGFGLPLALTIRMFTSYVMSGCFFSVLFPFFIISGIEAEPVTGVGNCPLKLFSPVIAIANTLFNKTIGAR